MFVREQQKPEGVPCCSARGAAGVIEELPVLVADLGQMSGTRDPS